MATVWSFPTRIVFGAGERKRTGEEARSVGVTRALLVTDSGVVKAGLAADITRSLEQAGIATQLFDGAAAHRWTRAS
jgi:alcohol dehydrogenase class IV